METKITSNQLFEAMDCLQEIVFYTDILSAEEKQRRKDSVAVLRVELKDKYGLEGTAILAKYNWFFHTFEIKMKKNMYADLIQELQCEDEEWGEDSGDE